jgi:hypothetical protein
MKAKGTALMLLKKKHDEEAGGSDEGEEPSMPPLEEVAGDLIAAVKADDKAGVAKALRAAQACMSDEPEDDTEDTDE